MLYYYMYICLKVLQTKRVLIAVHLIATGVIIKQLYAELLDKTTLRTHSSNVSEI